ncbi:MAG: hypothetical protein JWN13_2263 [Betaproteobacteria bacterium]|jgi:hypothetical protein|nr:hypothetical protein [Betaproteobacteria bacterium]
MHSKTLSVFIAAAALAVCVTSLHAQMRRQAGQAAAGVPVEVHLQVGASKYNASGTGECRMAERGSIYGVAASQFAVSHSAGAESLSLTLWQPKNGTDMVTLLVASGSKRYEVDTVKGGAKKDAKGSAQATVQRNGSGATITIAAVTAGGEKIAGTIKCGGLTPIQAEGG